MFDSWKLSCTKIPQRWVFAVMGSLAVTNALTMRVCLSLAITEMVTTTEMTSNVTSSEDTCPEIDNELISSNINSSGVYKWDEYTQGIILSSFYWGFIVTQIPSGILADKIGGKHILGLSIFLTAVLTILTPTAVQVYGATGLIILRILIGLVHGTTFPALNVLIANWAPPNERSKISTMVMSGMSLGTVMGSALSGVLIRYSSIGWPIVFYFYGALGILWYLAWVVLCYDHPDVHPFISIEEKKYLNETLNEHTYKRTQSTPWRHIMTSVPLWALLAGQAGSDWGLLTIVTDLPLYMSKILKFPIQENGFLTSLPQILMWLVAIVTSWIADWLIATDRISIKNTRKIFTTIATVGPAVFILAASYAGCDRIVVVILFTIGMGFMGHYYPSLLVNALDLSPNYSGTLMAILTVVTALTGIAAPYVVGVLTPNQTLTEWRLVFWITFVILVVSSLIFNIWGDGKVQYWNDPDFLVEEPKEPRNEKYSSRDISPRRSDQSSRA